MLKAIIGIVIITFITGFYSCNIINPDEPVPAYLHFNKFSFTDSVSKQPIAIENYHKFTDVWLFVDDQFKGAYELPATIPVLLEGNHKITAYPGILLNGIASTRSSYYYTSSFDAIRLLEPGLIDTVLPSTTYTSLTRFFINEEFEDSSTELDTTPESAAALEIITDPVHVFDGLASGKVSLANNGDKMVLMTDKFYLFTNKFKPVFLELNYKGNADFNISVDAYQNSSVYPISVLNIRQSENWNKIYIDLSSAIHGFPGTALFKLKITAEKKDSNPASEFYFDNIHLIN